MGDKFYLITSAALSSLPNLEVFCGGSVRRYRSWQSAEGAFGVLAWGRKDSALKAENRARRLGIPLIRIEDGFLRSVDPGSLFPVSLVWDDLGIYYDSERPSRLDELLRRPLAPDDRVRATDLVRSWRRGEVSKYNHARECDLSSLSPYVLVVDQTFGDASVRFGGADEYSFETMLNAALERFPNHRIVLKTHPEVIAGRKRGYFSSSSMRLSPRIELFSEDCHAPSLLKSADAVFCVTSQMGFEALIWGKEVHVFGMPFYAGRGLTIDSLPAPEFRQPVCLETMVHAALLEYPRYVDPETGLRCKPERIIEWMTLQRRQRERFPKRLYTPRVPVWKRRVLRQFLAGSDLVSENKWPLPVGATRVVWGNAESRHPTIRVEDGFIRSVGLGGDLVRPQSWVMDDVGMYYDASRPSRLEILLQEKEFAQDILERAAALITALRETGTTKYNTGMKTWRRPVCNRKVILVPGQVETDASIKFGAPALKSNLELLKAVRRKHPNAFLIYKPHPDVIAGLRNSSAAEEEGARWCDQLILHQDMAHLLGQVDEVHTITSLTGFEALIRGRSVTCYGQPFYSGWGLTTDVHPCIRRTRKRSLEELVAAALIVYPTYISRVTETYTTVETVLRELGLQRKNMGAVNSILLWFSRVLRRPWRH